MCACLVRHKVLVLGCRGGVRHTSQPRERHAGPGQLLCMGGLLLAGGLCPPGASFSMTVTRVCDGLVRDAKS